MERQSMLLPLALAYAPEAGRCEITPVVLWGC